MKLSTNLKALTAAAVLAVPAMAPTTASAEVGYNAAVSNMYLWRGQDASDGATFNGGIDYSHESGAYASIWASSGVNGSAGTASGGYEMDVWFGYAGEAGGLSYDLSYWSIEYPQDYGSEVINEVSLGLGYDMFSLGLTSGDNGYLYTTLGVSIDKFGVTIGSSTSDDSASDYVHYDLSYAATDSLSFVVSESDVDLAPALISVTYSLPIE